MILMMSDVSGPVKRRLISRLIGTSFQRGVMGAPGGEPTRVKTAQVAEHNTSTHAMRSDIGMVCLGRMCAAKEDGEACVGHG